MWAHRLLKTGHLGNIISNNNPMATGPSNTNHLIVLIISSKAETTTHIIHRINQVTTRDTNNVINRVFNKIGTTTPLTTGVKNIYIVVLINRKDHLHHKDRVSTSDQWDNLLGHQTALKIRGQIESMLML